MTGERGSSMVEVTLTVSLMLTVIFGIVECGRLMMAYTTLSDAARLGTRYAMVHGGYRTGSGMDGPSGPGNTTNIETTVLGLTNAAGLTPATVQVTYYPPASNPTAAASNGVGNSVQVTVQYTFNAIVPLIPLVNVTLSSTSEGTICY